MLPHRGQPTSSPNQWVSFWGHGRVSYVALNRRLSLDCGVLQMSAQVMRLFSHIPSRQGSLAALGYCLYMETLMLQFGDFIHHHGLLLPLDGFRAELLWCSPAQSSRTGLDQPINSGCSLEMACSTSACVLHLWPVRMGTFALLMSGSAESFISKYQVCLLLFVPQADGSDGELQHVPAEEACVREAVGHAQPLPNVAVGKDVHPADL